MVQTRRIKLNLKKKGITTRSGAPEEKTQEAERLNTEVAKTAASTKVGDQFLFALSR